MEAVCPGCGNPVPLEHLGGYKSNARCRDCWWTQGVDRGFVSGRAPWDPHRWMDTVGMIPDSPAHRAVSEAGRRLRESERDAALDALVKDAEEMGSYESGWTNPMILEKDRDDDD